MPSTKEFCKRVGAIIELCWEFTLFKHILDRKHPASKYYRIKNLVSDVKFKGHQGFVRLLQ